MKIVFLISFLFTTVFTSAQVGIGTNTPNNNSILDLSSTNKALLLPRVADTSLVAIPAAGMVVYNQQSQSPNFHDGARWNNFNSAVNSIYGSMTYTISGATSSGGITYDLNPLPAIDFNHYTFLPISSGGGGGTGVVQKADSLTFFKEFDGNSVVLKRAHMSGQFIPTIEINYFLPNGTKYYSMKLSSVLVVSQQNIFSDDTGKFTERYGLMTTTIGYKDWINNKSFSYNTATRNFGNY